jgi:hypothetical protein
MFRGKKKNDLTISLSQPIGKVKAKPITILNQFECPQLTRKIAPNVANMV